MIQIKSFTVNPLGVNCYVISDCSTAETAIIDPGMFDKSECEQVYEYIQRNHLHVNHILLTHGHFDHCASCQWAFNTFGVLPMLHPNDVELYQNCEKQILQFLHKNIKVELPQCKEFKETIELGETTIKAIHTPGHTNGGICYYIEQDNVVFSGDTLFRCSIGRTDLDTGNESELISSVKCLFIMLPNETNVLPGHGPNTQIEFEKVYNPYV